jgi:hypothetical protein
VPVRGGRRYARMSERRAEARDRGEHATRWRCWICWRQVLPVN